MALVAQPSPGCGTFEFDIASPLFEQILEAFDELESVPLTEGRLREVAERPGVYGLSHGGKLVYIGKADADVRGRLERHRRQVSGRVGITPEETAFRCLYLARTWDPFKPEDYLIHHYRTHRGQGWNGKGFGMNDPGRRRDRTDLGDDHWHVRFPLDPNWTCPEIGPGEYPTLELLRKVSDCAPYWVRFQGNRRGAGPRAHQRYEEARAAYEATTVQVPQAGLSVKELLLLVVQSLPDAEGWQLTQLPSHLLLYRERDATYPRMTRLWPPEGG